MVEKNVRKEAYKKMRGVSGFNTGCRIHKDPKHPTRSDRKIEFRKILKEEF